MADPRALLIFVSGPQKGQRKALPGGVVRAGRSPTLGIQLAEDYASREQMQFALTDDGWTVENLSAHNRTRINGKRYRKGQKVLLETGDVLGAGLETQILFVAPGDDPEAAYRAWQGQPASAEPGQGPPAAEVIGRVEPGGKDKEIVVLQPVEPEEPEQAPEEPKEEPEELTEEEEEAQRRKAKIKKYTILFGIYGVVIIAFFVVLSKVRPRGPEVPKGRPPELSKLDIQEVFDTKLDPTPNELASRKALNEAMRLWRTKRVDDGNLYRCIKQFKLAVAYSPYRALNDPEHVRVFTDAKKELLNAVWEVYEEGLRQSHAKAWRKAKTLFERLLRMIPAKDHPFPESKNQLFDNIVAHITYVQDQMARRKRR